VIDEANIVRQIGFELWTMQNDILFDNIYIGHSVEDAQALKKQTFDVKKPVESAQEEKEKPKEPEKPKSPMDLKFTDDPVFYIREKLDLFLAIAKRDPIQAAQFVPEIAGGIAVIVITVLALLIGALGAGAKNAPSKEQVKAKTQQVKEKAIDAKDQVAENVTSSAQAVQDETKKRTTRSSAQQ